MRDFPSIILQQSGAAIYAAQDLKSWSEHKDQLVKISTASCVFWNKRAIKFRSFEEYYPWEEGYPPLAFSTLSVARMAAQGAVSTDDVRSGFKVASQQLLERFEAQAANQQVAGLAALSWIHKVSPDLVSPTDLDQLIVETLKLQSDEGWFQEYGGPDLGYLSVTIDCLWDAFDATGDIRLIQSAIQALNFLDEMTTNTYGSSIGMHNARNTDYIVPYGIVRFLDDSIDQDIQVTALRLLQNVFTDSDRSTHFFSAVDDRYWCHYIGLSVLRSVQKLSALDLGKWIEPESAPRNIETYFPLSGYAWSRLKQDQSNILISMKKGGNFTIFSNALHSSDFGWIAQCKDKDYVSHWWSDEWRLQTQEGYYKITGCLFSHAEIQSNPVNHLFLRVASLIMGRRLITFLKKKLIFKKQPRTIGFSREIFVKGEDDLIEVIDTFKNLPAYCTLKRAPRASKRHVASADSFHYEDLSLSSCLIQEKKAVVDGSTIITTTYRV